MQIADGEGSGEPHWDSANVALLVSFSSTLAGLQSWISLCINTKRGDIAKDGLV